MLCVHGICLVLKAVGWKNECSCIGRRRNAYSILCPQMWISLERDVRWGRHILNTCFYIYMFFNSFWRQRALLLTLCPYSVLSLSYKKSSSLVTVTVPRSAVLSMCMAEGTSAMEAQESWSSRITQPGAKPALSVLRVL